mgnify:CR=1 FL=1
MCVVETIICSTLGPDDTSPEQVELAVLKSLKKFCEAAQQTDPRVLLGNFAKYLFSKLDKDASGSVEIKEIKFFLRKVVGLKDKDSIRKVATAIMRLATDDGGPISEADFVELIRNITAVDVGAFLFAIRYIAYL